jgi:FkbM family methyltransferase
VWDIGANLGLFTFVAAGLAGPTGNVLAVEPDTWLVGNLRRAVLANKGKIADVIVLPVAVSLDVGIASFFIANQSRACNALDGHGNSTTGGVRERQHVPTVSLDSLLDHFPQPQVVKVDVEHAELDLLRGAKRILTRIRPVILIEVSPDNQDAITEIFVGADYHMFDGEVGGEVNRATWTTIAIPGL